MKSENIIKYTNRVAIFSVGLMTYWVFIFVCITVFDFKVFRENLTEAFYLSILGIFALLGGAIILNIMLNMTKISETLAQRGEVVTVPQESSNKRMFIILLSFPLIFVLLFAGDYSSAQRKKLHLAETAEFLVMENKKTIDKLSKYSFSKEYIESAYDSLKVLSKVEEKFPNIQVIVQDEISTKQVYLHVGQWCNWCNKENKVTLKKEDYIFSTSKEERIYLSKVFNDSSTLVKFSSNDGKSELYFPVKTEFGTIVLYLSDRQRYGKIGS